MSVALDMQQVKRMRRIVLSSVACLCLQNGTIFWVGGGGGEVTEHEICDLIFSTIFLF